MSLTTVDSQGLPGLFEQRVGEHPVVIPATEGEVDASIRAHLGDSVIVSGHRAEERRDYVNRMRVGGALLVECALIVEGEESPTKVVEIDDGNRPFTEAVITKLGREAMGNKIWIRDSFPQS